MNKEEIRQWYKQWCKANGKNGGVLMGSSIKELLIDFYKHINENRTDMEVERTIVVRGYINGIGMLKQVEDKTND